MKRALLMIVEASQQLGWTPGKVRQRLQQQPGILQILTRCRMAVETILQSSLQFDRVPGLTRYAPA